ncbi:hypothetical protein SASPL_148879 [Salvia splendens]|uniref:Uncharacterized protein n=1 Tax=Salvia splendens TaxID=180675 RepID=A0A8X8WB11_SALSN|nr:uncharacterized protein LOC121780274 [Salvia splendens]KAG6391128.1 hypothetical protein SASPL_148879 [Salvia splendens]
MSSQPRRDGGPVPQLAADEQEVLKLEEELEEIAQKLLDYRINLSGQLSSAISSLLESQRLLLPDLDADAQDLMRDTAGFPVMADSDEAEKLQLLKQKISSNASAMPVVLNRLKEYMARIDALDSSNMIIHPAFKMKQTS